jgi:hypothetical protein
MEAKQNSKRGLLTVIMLFTIVLASPIFAAASMVDTYSYSFTGYTFGDSNSYEYDSMPQGAIYPVYEYYANDNYDSAYNSYYDGYNENYNMPIVFGPYPRQYLWHPYDENTPYTDYIFDDFHGYDSFIGYKDLDIFYPEGRIEVIRNPDSGELPAIDIPEGYGTFGSHVYGVIPGPNGTCLVYKKHYGDDHEWDVQTYNYNYGYYASNLAYRKTPTTCPSCQQKSICQLTHNC